jgi:hypothetical protein
MTTLARALALTVLAASAAALPACGGKSVKVENTGNSATMGQELQDLDKAYQDGIITKSEYEKSKKRILEGKR